MADAPKIVTLLLCSFIFIVGLPVHDGAHADADYQDCHQCILKGSIASACINLSDRPWGVVLVGFPRPLSSPDVPLIDRRDGFPFFNKAPPTPVL